MSEPRRSGFDAVVIGAGVIGAAVGYELGRRGIRTLNLDKLPAAGYGSTSNSCAIIRFSYSTRDGVAMAHYELHAWCLLVLGWLLVPFYARSMVFTMPEFLERRFNSTARSVLSLISLVAYVLTKIAVGIFAGGIADLVLRG